MIFRIENLEINTKGVFKALVLTSMGISIFRAIRRPRVYMACVKLDNQKTDENKSENKQKVESK